MRICANPSEQAIQTSFVPFWHCEAWPVFIQRKEFLDLPGNFFREGNNLAGVEPLDYHSIESDI